MPSENAWLEVEITREGDDVRVSGRASGSPGEPATHLLGLEGGAEALLRFAKDVAKLAETGAPLSEPLLKQAASMYRAVFRGGVDALRGALSGSKALVVRLRIADPELRKVPWEALAAPGQVEAFWGSSADLLPTRAPVGKTFEQSLVVERVRGALRVLVVAPDSASTVAALRQALLARIETGEVSVESIEGEACKPRRLLERLRAGEAPNVLHFVCHGGLMRGAPALCLGAQDDPEMWLSVATLAQHLEVHCAGPLRLVMLEACSGAATTEIASAAEILVQTRVDAVVAHLWPVEAELARICSVQLYGALEGTEGNVAAALNDARRMMLAERGQSAAAFSPVLYLRTGNPVLFDFRKQEPGPAGVSAAQAATPGTLERPWVLHQPPSDWVPRAGQKSWRYKVVAFDFDGTLLRGERFDFSWELVWRELHVSRSVQRDLRNAYRLRAEQATSDEERVEAYREWCESAVSHFRQRGLTRVQLAAMAKALSLTANCREALSRLRAEGVTTALISGGIQTMLEDLFPDFRKYFDFVFINELTFDADGLIAGVHATSFDFKGKADALQLVCDRARCSAEETVFVGDHFNDESIMVHAHLAIAYPPRDKLAADAAKVSIDQDNLLLILPHVFVE